MAKDYQVRQCKLRRHGATMTAYIPEKFAVKGKYLELAEKNSDEWLNGWEVIDIYSARMSVSEASKRSQDYKKARKATDI